MGLVWDDFSPEEQEQMQREKKKRDLFDRATLAERYVQGTYGDRNPDGTYGDGNTPTNEIRYPGQPGAPDPVFSSPVISGGPNSGKDPWQPGLTGPGALNPTPIQWGGGGQTGLAPTTPPASGGQPSGPIGQIGFGGYSPDNRDFYRQQFQQMRQRKQGEGEREMAAALRRAYPGPAPEASDPWAWAGGSEQFASSPVSGGGQGSGDWILNPAYDIQRGDTARQIVSKLGPVLNTDEQAMWNRHFGTEGVNPDSVFWSATPRADVFAQAFGGDNPNQSPEWTNALQKVLNNVWVREGDATAPGQPTVPAGYVSPTGG